ncbi:MAG: DUF1643 domain-containing protein [Planctomycetota bacterium]
MPVVSASRDTPTIERSAVFSRCERYRYELSRCWDPALPTMGLVMLNPSTADATHDDPTIRRCMSLASSNGFGSIRVCNLYAYRATSPADLRRAAEPIGPRNNRNLRALVATVHAVVIAWGGLANIAERARAADVLRLIGNGAMCFGTTASGDPRHPLYLRRSARLMPHCVG